jgi:hypothetical protein
MNDRFTELAGQLKRAAGAPEPAIARLVSRYGHLPTDYVQFLQWSNGAEGPVGPASYVSLWPVEQLEQRNDDYGVSTFAPGLLIFGSDGGDTAYAFDLRSANGPSIVVELPFIGMSLESVKPRGRSLTDLLEHLAAET